MKHRQDSRGALKIDYLVVGFLRLVRQWTQSDLAKASGMDRKTISRYESGVISPSREILERMAIAAEVTPAQLKQLTDLFIRIVERSTARAGLEVRKTQEELAAAIAAEVAAEIEPEILAALAQASESDPAKLPR